MNIPFIPPIPFGDFKFTLGLNFEKNSGRFEIKEVPLLVTQKVLCLRRSLLTLNAHTTRQTSLNSSLLDALGVYSVLQCVGD